MEIDIVQVREKQMKAHFFLLLSSVLDIWLTLLVIHITEFRDKQMKAQFFYLYPVYSIFN